MQTGTMAERGMLLHAKNEDIMKAVSDLPAATAEGSQFAQHAVKRAARAVRLQPLEPWPWVRSRA